MPGSTGAGDAAAGSDLPPAPGPYLRFRRLMPSMAVSSSDLIAVDALARCIGPVRQQREADITVQARQVVDFQVLDVLGERLLGRQHDRHDHERAQFGWRCRPRSSSSGSGRAPKRLMMLLFTSAIAASMASTRPDTASTTSVRSTDATARAAPQRPRQRHQREQRDAGDVAANSHGARDPGRPAPAATADSRRRFERRCDRRRSAR